MANSITTKPNLAVGDVDAGWKVLAIIDAVKGQYILEEVSTGNSIKSGLAYIGETNHNTTAPGTSGTTFTLAATLMDGDLLEVIENYNNNTVEDHTHWPRVAAGRTAQLYQYPSSANSLAFTFPATLTNQITIKAGAANQYIKTIRIWRNAALGYVVPTATTLFTPRNITGTGIAANTVGRDNTVSTIRITGLTAGSEIIAGNITASGGATVDVVDSGRSGVATIDVIPQGNDVSVSYSQTIWRRAVTSTLNGAASTVNGAASVNVDATKSFQFWLTLAAGQRLSTAPTVTNGTLLSWSADGFGEIAPTNSGDITIAANSVAISPVAKGVAQANAGVAVVVGTLRIALATSGNRSWQVQSNTGSNLSLQLHNIWNGGGSGGGLVNVTATPSAWTYFNSSWNFTSAGQNIEMLINDVTSGRFYNVRCEIGGSFNNNSYAWFEIV